MCSQDNNLFTDETDFYCTSHQQSLTSLELETGSMLDLIGSRDDYVLETDYSELVRKLAMITYPTGAFDDSDLISLAYFMLAQTYLGEDESYRFASAGKALYDFDKKVITLQPKEVRSYILCLTTNLHVLSMGTLQPLEYITAENLLILVTKLYHNQVSFPSIPRE